MLKWSLRLLDLALRDTLVLIAGCEPDQRLNEYGEKKTVQFDEVVLGRRSIRGYKDKPVPKALIKEILALAMRSPSSMNTQPWNFTVVSGETWILFGPATPSAI